MGSLCEFKNVAATLEKFGFSNGNFKITSVDFKKAIIDNKIDFDDGSIIFDDNGIKRKGYVYEPHYLVTKYGYPKFHVTKCSTIQEFVASKIFGKYYEWSNGETCNIADRNSKTIYRDVKLELCKNCLKELESYNADISFNTKEFYDKLTKEHRHNNSNNIQYTLQISLEEIKKQHEKEQKKLIEEIERQRDIAEKAKIEKMEAQERAAMAEAEKEHLLRRDSIMDLASELDDLLKRNGYEGDSLMKRLKSAEYKLPNTIFKNVREAVKMRNHIVHEGYNPSDIEINKTIRAFENILAHITSL
ncbi:MAG: hypothetical protein LBP54_08345 [Campylobacteraceae bacterium]|jgi:hypothetical protein|nr:hypothetical protein [Campylobacteraceae bacterium]